jgi:hypothetical protein
MARLRAQRKIEETTEWIALEEAENAILQRDRSRIEDAITKSSWRINNLRNARDDAAKALEQA